MKRLALAALCACVVFSCSRREPVAAPKNTLYRHLSGDPATLDPTTSTEEQGLQVIEMMFRPLLGIDAARRFVPGLAREWSVSPEGLLYEFRLDPEARWEDGSQVTSDDAAFTIERIRDPKVPAVTWRSGFENLSAIETPDKLTVRYRFDRPYAERLLAFTLPVVSRAAFSRAPGDVDRKPQGSGPYRLVSWEPNQKIVLARRSDAAGASAHFNEMVFRVLPDRAVWFQAGMRGELDEFRVTRDQRPAAEASADFNALNHLRKVPQPVLALLVWNVRHPLLSDPRARRALAHSWPRADTAKRLYPPEGATLISGPYPPGVPENASDVAPAAHDVAESRRLLDAAGWKPGTDGVRRKGGRRASVEVTYPPGGAIYTALIEIWTQAYRAVGVELVPRPLDWAAYAERISAGEFEAQLSGRNFIPPNFDPYSYHHSSQGPPNGQNSGHYSNPEADRVMEAAQSALDAGKRLELYRQVHRLLAQDPPADFLWGAAQYWGISKRILGVEISPVGLFHFLPGPLGWRPGGSAPAR
ncbi:MAG: ABC transporter substrate-binding protein [Thermoanaerobaculia bacterium]